MSVSHSTQLSAIGSAWQFIRVLLVTSLLLLSAYLGISEWLLARNASVTIAQRIATASQLLYGVAGALALLSLIGRNRWMSSLLATWGIALTVAGVMIPVAWGGDVWSGLSAGTAAAVAALLVSWGAIAHIKELER